MVCAAGTTSMPSGLARLDATLATYLVAATPIEQVSPVSACTRSRIVHAISAGLPCRRRAPDTSRNASSIDERLDQRRDLLEDAHDLLGVLRVARVVAAEHHRVRAPLQGDRHRHGRVHAEPARLVARRRDHAAAGGAADEHGLAAQVGSLEQFDGHEERVHVDVQDRGRRIVDGAGRDLPRRAVLLAHAATLTPAAVIDGGARRRRVRSRSRRRRRSRPPPKSPPPPPP